MPKIIFARLKVNDQKQITAGITLNEISECIGTSPSQLVPDPGCTCPITIKHGCRIDPSTNSTALPTAY